MTLRARPHEDGFALLFDAGERRVGVVSGSALMRGILASACGRHNDRRPLSRAPSRTFSRPPTLRAEQPRPEPLDALIVLAARDGVA